VDGGRIVQVLGNLVRNALNFTPRDGSVVVSVETRNEYVQFSVKDTGPGISAENLPRIFERYWQSSHGARNHGSGLGLSIAKGIVDAHGGRIWAESTGAAGSQFHFTIPVGALGPGSRPNIMQQTPD
jgi:signal transduction histidine kinase